MTDVMPSPQTWPVCSECDTDYVLRRCFVFRDGGIVSEWLWQRDCKHKKAEAKIHPEAP